MRTVRENGTWFTSMLRSALSIFVLAGSFHFLLPEAAFSQGETTSAIIGQVSDASGAAVPGATVTVTNKETGLRRSASSDDSDVSHLDPVRTGFSCGKWKRPESSLLALRLSPVSLFVTVTVAPGTAAPLASLTWPMIALVVSPWEKAASGKRK